MSNQQIVSASRVIHAPPEEIFALLADAGQHAEFDGSGMVQGTRGDPQPLTLGSTFGMAMKLGLLPYPIRNTVVEYEPDRLIAWKHFGAHRWRYELEPVDGDSTKVTESFDWSHYPTPLDKLVELVGYPARNRAAIDATLERLAELVEGAA